MCAVDLSYDNVLRALHALQTSMHGSWLATDIFGPLHA